MALPHLVSAQYCPTGATTSCNVVLIVCADLPSSCAYVKSILFGTGAFTTVDTFDARSASSGGSGTPSASLLGGYCAVIVYSNDPFADATLLGNRLAAFHDQGGGVVVTYPANTPKWGGMLQGAYSLPANGYALMNYAQGDFRNTGDNMQIIDSQSPLMTGITSLTATFSDHSTAPTISGRAVVVAQWRFSTFPLVLSGMRGNRTLVELNFFPPRNWAGDGALLLRNGLKYSQCMQTRTVQCSLLGTFSAAGTRSEVGESPAWYVANFAAACLIFPSLCLASSYLSICRVKRHPISSMMNWPPALR
jgi:hypothetical protein